MSALYLVAIVLRHDIASVRDLNSSHIPFLTGIRDEILDIVKKTYSLDRSHLKIFIHCKLKLRFIGNELTFQINRLTIISTFT